MPPSRPCRTAAPFLSRPSPSDESPLAGARLFRCHLGGSSLLLAITPRADGAIAPALVDALLNPAERAHASRLTFAKRQADWLSGRLIARHTLAELLDLPSARSAELAAFSILPEETGERAGQPRVRQGGVARPDLHVSISHWPEAVAAVVGCAAAAIDGE